MTVLRPYSSTFCYVHQSLVPNSLLPSKGLSGRPSCNTRPSIRTPRSVAAEQIPCSLRQRRQQPSAHDTSFSLSTRLAHAPFDPGAFPRSRSEHCSCLGSAPPSTAPSCRHPSFLSLRPTKSRLCRTVSVVAGGRSGITPGRVPALWPILCPPGTRRPPPPRTPPRY